MSRRAWMYSAAFCLALTGCDDAEQSAPDTAQPPDAGSDVVAGPDSSAGADATADSQSANGDVDTAIDTDDGPRPPTFGVSTDPVWMLTTDLPHDPLLCRDSNIASPCTDLDDDGLVDAWENLLLASLGPRLVFDESEPLVDDPAGLVAGIGRVFVATADPLLVRVVMVLAYHQDYGSCAGISSHRGDPERVAVELAVTSSGTEWIVAATRFYTAAHEGTATDHSLMTNADDSALVFDDESHWTVFSSGSKHASYPSIEACETAAAGIPCLDEDCAPDGVADPDRFELLVPMSNAGEEASPRLTDLDPIGFPGDHAWADQPFCGGQATGSDECSASILEKLVDDPFL